MRHVSSWFSRRQEPVVEGRITDKHTPFRLAVTSTAAYQFAARPWMYPPEPRQSLHHAGSWRCHENGSALKTAVYSLHDVSFGKDLRCLD